MATVLGGSVQSGHGLLAPRMREHFAAYTRLAGIERLEAAEVGVGVNLVPCRIFDRPAFVFRTDQHESSKEHHRLIELLASVRLRDAYGLNDGDRVAIEFGS